MALKSVKTGLAKVPSATMPASRVIIYKVTPCIDSGRYPAKCVLGSRLPVEAVVLCDGHESLKVTLSYRHDMDADWTRLPMRLSYNDTYSAVLPAEKLGVYHYTVEAAIDRYDGWRQAFFKKLMVGEATPVDVQTGLDIIDSHGAAVKDGPKVLRQARDQLAAYAGRADLSAVDAPALRQILDDGKLVALIRNDRSDPSRVEADREWRCVVDPAYAGFSSWYEFFPRSRWRGVADHGTLKDAARRLDYVKDLGFDIVYLPPIHPIGVAYRKGRNNSLTAAASDLGSPWAIGGREGGHKSIHPALGTFDDFASLIKKARGLEIEIALDIAFQCAPDHPYVKEHPEWFRKRADGSIQYAENPPKKYQDIYPFDFECAAWQSLWDELKSVIQFWIDKGVRVFRVDNPHTKSFPFWEWALGDIRARHPEVIFLAEAFTKPHVMAHLAKIGFNQSYTYFAWRYTKPELTAYMEELTRTELKDYFRPNFWPNTPDILTAQLQAGGRSVFMQRLILAATLTASYGIYGPAYELMEHLPAVPGKEEYLNSEKYEAREWDVNDPYSLAPLIKRINRIRRDNPALQNNHTLQFHPVDNAAIMAYTKRSEDEKNIILVVINLDGNNRQSGIVDLQIQNLGLDPHQTYQMHDLLSDAKYSWTGWRNFVDLEPHSAPAHIFRIQG